MDFEKPVTPKMPAIRFTNTVTVVNRTTRNQVNVSVPIKIRSELNLFAFKYVFSSSGFQNLNGRDIFDDCIWDNDRNLRIPGKGQEIGFSLIFGNFGDRTYVATGTIPTVEDVLDLTNDPGVVLDVMDISVGNNTVENLDLQYSDDNGVTFKTVNPSYVANPTKLLGGIRYLFRVRNNGLSVFNIPCKSVFSLSVLLQVENAGCLRDVLD